MLDIADFAGALLGSSPNGGRLLPLYHRTYFMFYNQSLLEKHRLPAPDYRTFATQTEYLQNIAPKLTRLGFNPKPYCTQEPVTLMGGQIKEFCQGVVSGTVSPQARADLVAAIDKLIAYCQLFRYSLKDRNDWMQARLEFVRGQSPFFMGYSVDYWELSQKKLPFELKAYPTLCCDDTFFLWPRIGQISRRSEHPMESMHFLLFLLREEVQKRFADTGNYGGNLTQDFRPETTAAQDWTLGRAAPVGAVSLPQFRGLLPRHQCARRRALAQPGGKSAGDRNARSRLANGPLLPQASPGHDVAKSGGRKSNGPMMRALAILPALLLGIVSTPRGRATGARLQRPHGPATR